MTPHISLALLLTIPAFGAPSSEEPTLAELVRQGDAAVVVAAFEKGANANETDAEGNTLLNLAVQSGYDDVVKALLDAGADANAVSADGRTPLALAIIRENENMVRILLAAGANPNAISADEPPVYIAAKCDFPEMVRILAAGGADCNKRSNGGFTPLSLAAQQGYAEVVRALLDCGADANARIELSGTRSALCMAAQNGHADVVAMLLEAGADPMLDLGENNPLYSAVSNGHSKVVKLLLAHGANPMQAALIRELNRMVCPLEVSVAHGDVECTRLLLESGVDPNVPDSFNRLPLVFAAYRDNEEMLDLLLAHGADVNLRAQFTALEAAVERRNVPMIRKLLAAGANPALCSDDGHCSLLGALSAGDEEIARVLIEAGALTPELVSKSNSLLVHAASHNMIAIMRELIAKGAPVNVVVWLEVDSQEPETENEKVETTPLKAAIDAGHAEAVKLLIESGVDVNASTALGCAPVLYAFACNKKDIAELLIQSGADVKAKTENDITVLMCAAEMCSAETVAACLNGGCDVNARNENGQQAIAGAIKRGDIEILRMLIEAGADLSPHNEIDRPLIIYAVASQNTEMLKYVISLGVDVNALIPELKQSAFWCAASIGNYEMMRVLAEHGADVHTVDVDGFNALDVVIYRYGKHGMADLLLQDVSFVLSMGVKPSLVTQTVLENSVSDFMLRMDIDRLLYPNATESNNFMPSVSQ